jgi:hypothetical protein
MLRILFIDFADGALVAVKPASERVVAKEDFALIVPAVVTNSALVACVREAGGGLVEDGRVIDVYEGAQVEAVHKSLAVNARMRAAGHKLNADEVLGVRDRDLGSSGQVGPCAPLVRRLRKDRCHVDSGWLEREGDRVSKPGGYSEGGRPETFGQHALEGYKEQFAKETRTGRALLSFLKRSDVGIWMVARAKGLGHNSWWLHLTLPESQREMFALSAEVLLLYTEFDYLEPRVFGNIQERISNESRLEVGLAIVVSNDENVGTLNRHDGRSVTVVPISLTEITSGVGQLRERLASAVASVDYYDTTSPIHDAAAFYGRSEEIAEIQSALDLGNSVGVFGLRKAGKTSLLAQIIRTRNAAGKIVARLDLSSVASADQFRLSVVETVCQAVRGALESQQPERNERFPRLLLLNVKGEPKGGQSEVALHWLRDLRVLLDIAPARVELVVDEIDQAYPDSSRLGEGPGGALYQCLVQLRGLLQTSSDTDAGLVLLCAGVDPALFESPVLSGSDNLLYRLVRLQWLGPMPRDEMAGMVRGIGRRMGVRVKGHEPIDLLFDEFGGHPLLTRQACSIACRSRSAGLIPFYLDVGPIEAALGEQGVGTLQRHALDVFDSFEHWFPREAGILRALWSRDPADKEVAQAIVDDTPSEVEHAVAYGLLFHDLSVRIGAVKRQVA